MVQRSSRQEIAKNMFYHFQPHLQQEGEWNPQHRSAESLESTEVTQRVSQSHRSSIYLSDVAPPPFDSQVWSGENHRTPSVDSNTRGNHDDFPDHSLSLGYP